MLLHYLKITLRNIRRHKGYAFINVAGLAISLTCCMLIGLWILNERSYDKHYPDNDRIQAILTNGNFHNANAMAAYIEENVPEIQHAARLTWGEKALINSGTYQYFERLLVADPQILEILSFSFLAGDSETALDEPNSIVITQEAAAKLFPDELAIGKTLSINNQNEFIVKGIIENIPINSSFRFDILTSIEYHRQEAMKRGWTYDAWNVKSTRTLVKTQPGVTASALSDKISGAISQFYENEEVTLSAINVGDLYLRFSETNKGIKVFAAIALAILLMACINYVNLSTARFRIRGRETGIRKVIGASRGALIGQFLAESFFMMVTGTIFALCLVDILLPFFNSLFGMRLSLALLNKSSVISLGAVIVVSVTVATGIYPAIVLSRFRPAQTLKKGLGSTNRHFTLRRVLVVSQFSLTAVLIIGTAVIYAQINHMKSWDVGYNKQHVVNIRLRGESRDKYDALRNELRQNPQVVAVTAGMSTLPYWQMESAASWDGLGSDEERNVSFNFVKYDFTKTFGIELVEGRDFDESISSDEESACLVNETLAQSMDRSPVIGNSLDFWENELKIIGIMKDFNFSPLTSRIEPLLIRMVPGDEGDFLSINQLSIRISPDNISSTLAFIEKTWNRVVPNHPFEYEFLDQQFNRKYSSLEQVNNLAVCFGLLAIFIAALGLFGLASFTAEQRTKEIGIRKVLGASVLNIVRMVSKEYVILVIISNVVAWPLAWYIMRDWLSEFAYHIDIGVSTFFVVGCFTLIVALLSVGYQAVRAANINPVDAIEYE